MIPRWLVVIDVLMATLIVFAIRFAVRYPSPDNDLIPLALIVGALAFNALCIALIYRRRIDPIAAAAAGVRAKRRMSARLSALRQKIIDRADAG